MTEELQPARKGEAVELAEVLREVAVPFAEADKHRSVQETERYRRAMDSRDKELERGHHRFILTITVVGLLLFALLGLAFYALRTGNTALATHLITGIFSFLGGVAAGLGSARRARER